MGALAALFSIFLVIWINDDTVSAVKLLLTTEQRQYNKMQIDDVVSLYEAVVYAQSNVD